MSAIYIDEASVGKIFNINDAVKLTEEAFSSYASGTAFNMTRQRMRIRKGALHILPGAIPYKNVIGYKAYTSFKDGTIFRTFLHNAENGQLLAIIDSNEIGRLRTGAASAVASKYLARKNSETLFIFGSGYQAEAQVEAICSIMKIKKLFVYSRTLDNAKLFAKKMSEKLPLVAEVSSDIASDLKKADIITTITTSSKPLFEHDMLPEGVHINAAGANSLIRTELPEKTIEKADIVTVDSKEVALVECGDILALLEKGRIHLNEIVELGDIVAGFRSGRKNDNELTIFESQGMGLQDIACAEHIYRLAVKNNIGITLPF